MFYSKLCCLIEILIIIAFNAPFLHAQDDTRVTAEELKKMGNNYFNYSDPGKVNIEINVLGGVKNPGKYLVPEGTTVIELLTLTGTVLKEETSGNIKLIRSNLKNGKISDNKIIMLNYIEMFKDEQLKSINASNPVLLHGDILVVPITPEKNFWDYYQDISIILTPLIAVATLIISIISLNQ